MKETDKTPCDDCGTPVIKTPFTAPGGKVYTIHTPHICRPTRRVVTKEGTVIIQ